MSFPSTLRTGTAGWGIPKAVAPDFPGEGSHLARYARVFDAVEINSSFHRPHRLSTYQRWADAVPEGFRFAVKIPKAVTHESRLREVGSLLDRFLMEVGGLGPKLGPFLVQLPPSLPFEVGLADRFLTDLRARVEGPIACEPRHPSWFACAVGRLLEELRIGRVAADPPPMPSAGHPGGWAGLTYCRLHGAPRIYHSAYADAAIQVVTAQLVERHRAGSTCWCIFDNTAAGAATPNALTAQRVAASGLIRL